MHQNEVMNHFLFQSMNIARTLPTTTKRAFSILFLGFNHHESIVLLVRFALIGTTRMDININIVIIIIIITPLPFFLLSFTSYRTALEREF